MLIVLAFAIGFLVGWRRAAQRDGDRLDRLQYGAAHGIAFMLAVVVISIVIARLGLVG